jgi:hypothetical protein
MHSAFVKDRLASATLLGYQATQELKLEWPASRPCRSTTRETFSGIIDLRISGPQSRSRRYEDEKISVPTVNRKSIPQL